MEGSQEEAAQGRVASEGAVFGEREKHSTCQGLGVGASFCNQPLRGQGGPGYGGGLGFG
jgi:hypothetical protein